MNKVYVVLSIENNSGGSLTYREFEQIHHAFSTADKALDHIGTLTSDSVKSGVMPPQYLIREIMYD